MIGSSGRRRSGRGPRHHRHDLRLGERHLKGSPPRGLGAELVEKEAQSDRRHQGRHERGAEDDEAAEDWGSGVAGARSITPGSIASNAKGRARATAARLIQCICVGGTGSRGAPFTMERRRQPRARAPVWRTSEGSNRALKHPGAGLKGNIKCESPSAEAPQRLVNRVCSEC